MKFTELESIMSKKGINSLADIARTLNTTPQAVSNWKARDQVPYHIIAKINQMTTGGYTKESFQPQQFTTSHSPFSVEEKTISVSDILLSMAEQLKLIFLVPFITIFITFTYVQFIQQPKYMSQAVVLLPEKTTGNLGGIAGIASQFGVNIPTGVQADLSSPSLFPELLSSRIFAEKILDKLFYTEKFGKKLTLLAILTHGASSPEINKNKLVTSALGSLQEILEFYQDPNSTFSVLTVTTFEPIFSKELAEVVLMELEDLNRFFKTQSVIEKTTFIEERIASVKGDLEMSEKQLKMFSEQNRQTSSPALQLEQDRYQREIDVQKGIYLTLKQQLELAKIEEVQETSIVQVLDKPQVPLGSINKNIRLSIFLAGVLGIGLGILLGFFRTYLNNSDIDERRKLRRGRNFLKKKGKEIIFDRRISAIVSILMIVGLPFYLGHKSSNPVFFSRYSPTLMIVNIIYILTLIAFVSIFIFVTRKKT